MNLLFSFLLAAMVALPTQWGTNMDTALQQAKQENKLVLLNFSGSDWCGPCMKLRRDVLETDEFLSYAKDHLVLVNADFPRQKKNKLEASLVARNEALAEKYNPKGVFPFTVLLDTNGKVLKSWEGNPGLTPSQLIDAIRTK
jgi:Thioredoxin-related protein